MNDQLFAVSDLNPLSPDHRPASLVEDQGGRVWDALGDVRPRQNVYARAASGFAPYFPDEGPTYSEEKSERIKREYPIELFASQHLRGGKKHGAHVIKYVCPWHLDDEKSPNLDVYLPGHKRSGQCHCYRCGEGGSVVDLAMAVFHVSEPGEAMRLIEGKSQFSAEKRFEYAAEAKRFEALPRPEINAPEHIHRFALLAAERLQHDPQVIRYLTGRGLGGAIKMLHLGSSFHLPHGAIPQKLDDDLQVIPHTNFLRRLVIPYLTPEGRAHCVNARALDDRQPKYLKPASVPHQPYYLDCALNEGEDIVMTEGELDCISLMLALKNDPIGVFAVPGLHCFSETAAAKLSGRRVFIVTDNDAAGNEGREKLAEMVYGYAKQVYHIEVKAGFNDVNKMLAKEGRRYVAGWFGGCVQGAVRPTRRLVWSV